MRQSPASTQIYSYGGRAPHEALFTPEGTEVWVTLRGENYVQVLGRAQFRGDATHDAFQRARNGNLLASPSAIVDFALGKYFFAPLR